MKKLIIGLVAVVAAFGIGMAVPNVMAADVKVDDYEKAMAIIEGNYAASQIPETDTNETADAKPDNASIDDSEATTEASAVENSDAADVQTEDAASGDGAPNRDDVEIDEDTVILDWDYRDWAIAGVKLSESDYDKVLENLGIDKTAVTYSDGGFKIDRNKQWKDKKASSFATCDEEGGLTTLYWDGNKYVTEQLDEKEADRMALNLEGTWSDKDSWEGYWALYYGIAADDIDERYGSLNRDIMDVYKAPYTEGMSSEDIKEISEFLDVPFIGGNYQAMDSVFHTDEMIEKGMKDISNSGDDREQYIVKTNLGMCRLTIYTYNDIPEWDRVYDYSFENDKYEFLVDYSSENDTVVQIHLDYTHSDPGSTGT